MKTAIWLLVGLCGLLVVVRIVLTMAGRFQTDEEFERERDAGSSVGNAFLAVQSLFEPDRRHALEFSQSSLAEQQPLGEPPDPGRDSGAGED